MKLLNKIPIIFLFVFFSNCTKQEPSAIQEQEFYKSFGGAFEDIATDMIFSNGYYYLLGNMQPQINQSRIAVIKTDAFGNKIWEKQITEDDKITYANDIIKLKNNPGFAILGTIENDTDSLLNDIYFVHIGDNGQIISTKIIELYGRSETGIYIAELEDGNLTIGANSTLDSTNQAQRYFFPIDISGNFVDSKLPVYKQGTNVYSIYPKPNNDGYFVTGINDNTPVISEITTQGFWNGNYKFDNHIGEFNDLYIDNKGFAFITGKSYNGKNGENDACIAQVNIENEEILWSLDIGSTGDDWGNNITETNDGNLLIIGSQQNKQLDTYDILIAKISKSGTLIKSTILGGNDTEYGIKILNTSEESIVIEATNYIGNTSFISLIKTNY